MENQTKLTKNARFSLFIVSYFPLFLILTIRQLYDYSIYIHWAGLNLEGFFIYLQHFGAITIFSVLTLYGFTGLIFLLKNMKRRVTFSGDTAIITDIENKNNESLSYLFTYLLPFLFQDLSNPISLFSLLILLIVTFFIYTNSSMLLINPTLSLKYTIFQVEFKYLNSNKTNKGMIISEQSHLNEDDIIKIKPIGSRLYYSIITGTNQ
ncbi:hypothetical protein [Leptospira terpstrae]|uniref:Uncharacterized protein n=1 Tax=Leptospira terpstrae serovar Hualin str. LT 11-33 = ATCC 700639 TaxID=1257025 RepID=N1VW44_9LEPT|nr:hypothetical protein [Leptospira terpstrae]EMY61275.1 hypothetical protein LEP1GSC203_1104 [Leptospira terpstrae serovar Hualin str. LT 11-33 = ATCC 700639]